MYPFSHKLTHSGLLAVSAFMSQSLHAGSVSIPNSFTAGEPAVAAEVNANFDAVKTAVDDNDSRIAALEATIATLRETVTTQAATITSLQNNSVLALDGRLLFVTDSNGYPTAQFTGVNVQVINGVNQYTANGVGNLIVGYNRTSLSNSLMKIVCSNGAYTDQNSCEANGGVWAKNHKSGSHNLVGGDYNSYASTGGLVFGTHNAINRQNASVTGGKYNVASGVLSSVSGGRQNTASGEMSSVSGGMGNDAIGDRSSISGGFNSIASGNDSSVSGGNHNTASGLGSSVSGGFNNTASGNDSSVSGGVGRNATGSYDWSAGSLFEDS